MGMWSNANNKPDSKLEKLGYALNREDRHRQRNRAEAEEYDRWKNAQSAPGGQTPRRNARLSGKERRAANKILGDGKQS